IVHQDLSFSNLWLFEEQGDVLPLIADLETSSFEGTPSPCIWTSGFEAPEVIAVARYNFNCERNSPPQIYHASKKADICSFGKTLSVLIESIFIIEGSPVPEEINAVLSKASAELPEDRYTSMREFRDELIRAYRKVMSEA